MKVPFAIFISWLLSFGVSFGQAPKGRWLLYNVNVVRVQNGTLQENTSVLIEGGTIKSIGDFLQLNKDIPGNRQIDGKGKYLIPGLWDMHVHLEGADLIKENEALLPVFLAYGITTVRDCASDLGEQVLAWRDEIAKGSRVGPTLFTAGRKLEGKNSIWKGDLEIENETELTQMLDLLDRYRVDFVKITENTLHGELFLASVKAAHQRGYRVSGHVPFDVTIPELVLAGYSSIEHASYLLRLGSDEASIISDVRSGKITRAEADARFAANFDQQRAIEQYRELGRAGLFVCPTFIGGKQLAYLRETDHSKDEFLNYLSNRFVANYQWRIQRMANDTPEQQQKRKDNYQHLLRQLPHFQQAGLRILAGSDAAALNTYVYPAESLIQELEIFQEAGLTPLHILQSATMNGAYYFNTIDRMATIDVGKKADLVLLDENPLADISALRKVQSVIANGVFYDRMALDKMLERAREVKLEIDRQK